MNKLYSLGLYEKALPPGLSWKEKLLAAGDAGFDFLEMSIDESAEKLARLDMEDSEIAKLIQLMEKQVSQLRPYACPVIGNIHWAVLISRYA